MRVLGRVALLLLIPASLFLLAARFPAWDSVTQTMPHPVRSAVATMIVRENLGVEPDPVGRALALDPQNAAAWAKRCTSFLGFSSNQRLEDCQHAAALHPTTGDLRALAEAYEDEAEPCLAADAYRRALGEPEAEGQRPMLLREEARAALNCGNPEASLSALHKAEQIDLNEAADFDQMPPALRDSLSNDRGTMSVVYARMNRPEQAAEACAEANPGWSSCSCELNVSGLSCAPSGPVLHASAGPDVP